MIRQKIKDVSDKSIKDFDTPMSFVRAVLDSVYYITGDHELYGHTLLARRYKDSNNEGEKKKIAECIVKLLDDPDYSCDAIPVAAELGLEEAKEWFLNLSKKSIEEIRQIKTNSYSNGFGCLLNFTQRYKEFLAYLKTAIEKDNLTTGERLWVLNKITKHDPGFILSNYKDFIVTLFNAWDEKKMGLKKHLIYNTLCEAFENSRLENCLFIAKEMKNDMPKDIQLLYFNSLKQLPKYQPHLEELKKILEINN